MEIHESKKHFLAISACQVFDARNQTKDLSVQILSTKRKLSIEILVEKIKQLVLE